MNKVLKIIISLAMVALASFIYLKKSQTYLQGNPILLIDHLNEERIQYSGLRRVRIDNQTYSLNGSWKAIEKLRNKSSIWRTKTPAAIRAGADVQLLYKGTPVSNSDALRKQTLLPAWNVFNDQIWIAHDSIQPPANDDYVLKYQRARTKEVTQTISRKLTSEDLVCLTTAGEAQRKIFFVALPDEAKNSERSTIVKVSVNGSVAKTKYSPGILNDFHQTERNFSLYLAEDADQGLTLQSLETWSRTLKIPRGRSVLHLIARKPFPQGEPVLQISLNNQPVSSFQVSTQEWKDFYLVIDTQRKTNKIELDVSGASGKSGPHLVSPIQIREISISPSGPGTALQSVSLKGRRKEESLVRWEQTNFWKSSIYQPQTETVLKFSTRRPLWMESRYYLPGPVSIILTARSDQENGTPVHLGVYLAKKRIGELAIASGNQQQYRIETFTPGGWAALKFVPEAGEGDPARQVFIQDILVYHHPGILVSTPNHDDFNPEINVHFQTDVPIGMDSLRTVLSRRQIQDGSPGSLTIKKEVERETRNSFLLQPRITVKFPVHLPQDPVLKFSFNAERGKCEASPAELVIRSQPAWGFHRTLLQKPLNFFNKWVDQEISLESYSNKKTILTFETRNPGGSDCPVDLWLGNPYITSKSTKRKPKTVILFSADALRADHLGSYGYHKNTSPMLDQFSKESVLFENAISQAPWTLPSFASLLTSLYPSFHGAYYRDSKLESSYHLLPEIFKNKKYLTAGYTKNGFLNQHRGFVQGFDWFHAAQAESTGEERLNQIFTWLEQNRGQDLFLLVHFLEPHSPYDAPEEYIQKFVGSEKREHLDTTTANLVRLNDANTRLNPEERDYLISLYDAEIAYLDSIFGRFRRKLQELDLYDSSLLVFLSDHGEEFQDHGKLMHTARLYQELVHVPLIIKFPADSGIRPKRVGSTVALVDVMPTILDSLKLQSQASLQGRSLLPVIHEKEEPPRIVITERNDVRMIGIIDGSYKYIYRAGIKSEEVYDLKNDPDEKENLAASRADLLKQFQQKRDNFFAHVANFKKQKTSDDATVEISEEDEKNLRALGYVQ